jgi:hypothetical protein
MFIRLIPILLLLTASCAGYRFQKRDNPFSQYSISSLSVPMFYNHSNFSNISGAFTSEVYQMLAGFKGLKVASGKESTDATLIGIITSRASLKESRLSTGARTAKGIIGEEFAPNRNDFVVPTNNIVQVNLRIVVMKHPTAEEIKLLQTSLGSSPMLSSKIIFTENIPVVGTFTREVYTDEGMEVNSTQNRGAQKTTITNMAKNAAVSFRDMILYAF